MREEDVEQTLGKMTRGAQGLHIGGGMIPMRGELAENGEQPGAVFLEYRLFHNEHVAEGRTGAVEYGVGIFTIIGVHRA